ncbi:MAG: glycosyltransferase family 39 protein, partial [Myxococcota bacterium]
GYFHMGRHLADGIGYVRWADLMYRNTLIPTAEYPPLFPFLLASLQLLGETSLEGQRLIVGMMGAVNVALVSVLGRTLVNARTGMVAGAMAALSPSLIEMDGSFMAEALYVPLIISSYILILRALRKQTFASWLGVGAVLGLCSLTRSEALLLLPLLVVPLIWIGLKKKRLVAVAAATIGLGAVILPWTVRNALEVEAFVPVSQNFKGVLLGANCDWSYDITPGSWMYKCVLRLEKDMAGLSEAETFDRWRDTGIRFMWEHMDRLPYVVGARVLRTWGLYQPGRWYGVGENEVRNRDFSRYTWWLGWLLLALMPPGLALMWVRSPVRFGLMLGPILLVTLTSAVAYGNVRFRAAAEPALIVLAATSLTAGWTKLRGTESSKPPS